LSKDIIDISYLRKNNLILLECISGSRAYNLDIPTSDTDIKGVFYLPKKLFYGFEYIAQVSNDSNDIVFYEIGRFLELLTKNNPNILELLDTPEDKIISKHPIMENIEITDFLSKKCKDTFGGYAFTQVKKARGLNKKIANPISKIKKTILDFCYVLNKQGSTPIKKWLTETNKDQNKIGLVNVPNFQNTFGLYYDEKSEFKYKGILNKANATTVLLSSIPKGEIPITYLQFNQNGYVKYCKDYKDYWSWVEKRNESRYENNIEHGKNYDSKNMMHTFRLLDMAVEILEQGKIFVKRENREELLDIRAGKYEYEELIDLAGRKMQLVETAFENSKLQESPPEEKIEELLVHIRNELYKKT